MDYVYTSPSLSQDLCEKIIQLYDSELHMKYQGVTASGLDKSVKDTEDMMIPENEEWEEINRRLSNELQKHVKLYTEKIGDKENFKKENNFGTAYHHLQDTLIQPTSFMIQKYDQQKGKYIYHNDSSNEPTQSRVLTYLWYLNDVEEGGETEFFGGTFRIKPESGKLLLFPACWCYPHRGNIPISSNKYIVTGWLYTETKKYTKQTPKISFSTIPSEKQVTKQVPTQESFHLFKYFYKDNGMVFRDYKQTKLSQESLFVEVTLSTYTPIQCRWIKNQLSHVIDTIKLDTLPDLMPFILASFPILVDEIKKIYRIKCDFNIVEWLVGNSMIFDKEYDLCIQTDLLNGDTLVSKRYKTLHGLHLVYLIEFTFHYVDEQDEKKIATLKQLADPCLDLI